MNKLIFFAQLLFIYGINGFTTPEECLQELKCNDELNCVAYCYNVPSPDSNSATKTADCQNGCLAKYPNNLPTDWANLNQCYLDCVQNNYFYTPPSQNTNTGNNNNNNVNPTTTTTTSPDGNTTNNNINTNPNANSNTNTTPQPNNTNTNPNTNGTPNNNGNMNPNNNNLNTNNGNTLNGNTTNNTTSNDIYSNTFKQNNTITANNGQPINATDHINNVVAGDESSYIPGFTLGQTFVNIAIMFLVFLIFN